jgi:hypothetical protein
MNTNSKIIIMHEEIESLKHDQFMKRLGSIHIIATKIIKRQKKILKKKFLMKI